MSGDSEFRPLLTVEYRGRHKTANARKRYAVIGPSAKPGRVGFPPRGAYPREPPRFAPRARRGELSPCRSRGGVVRSLPVLKAHSLSRVCEPGKGMTTPMMMTDRPFRGGYGRSSYVRSGDFRGGYLSGGDLSGGEPCRWRRLNSVQVEFGAGSLRQSQHALALSLSGGGAIFLSRTHGSGPGAACFAGVARACGSGCNPGD